MLNVCFILAVLKTRRYVALIAGTYVRHGVRTNLKYAVKGSDTMDFSFNGEIAKLYGVDEAVFIHNLYWWIAKNEANGQHFYDGKSWTYNSMEAFTKLFPFWTKKQVRRIVNNLVNNGAIYTGNYNQAGFDRTQWYSIAETVTSIYSNGHTQMTEWAHPSDRMGTPIPDIKPDIKPDIILKENIKEMFSDYTSNSDLLIALSDYEAMRKSIKSPMTDKAKQLLLNKLDLLAKTDIEKIELLNEATLSNWKSVYPTRNKTAVKCERPEKKPSYNLEKNFKSSWTLVHEDD